MAQAKQEVDSAFARARLSIAKIPKNGKFGDDRNPKYLYATADDVYSAVGKALSEQGLGVWCNEVKSELFTEEATGKPTWIHAVYELAITPGGEPPEATILSVAGDERLDRATERLTFSHPYFGVQSFSAIRTYAIKTYLRGKLLLDTGELDADDWAKSDTPYPLDIKPEQADPDATGTWEFDEKTRQFTAKGQFSTPQRQEAMAYASIRKMVGLNRDSVEAIEVYKANKDLIASFADEGRKQIAQMMVAHDLRIKSKQKKQAEQQTEEPTEPE